MKKIQPYKNIGEAMESLDNGGRFYKIQTQANDGIIDQSELANVVGTSSDKQLMILFLQMSVSKLEESDKASVFSKFDSELIGTFEKFKPQELAISEASIKGKLSSNIIIKGTPEFIPSKTDLDGFIMFPRVIRDITTFEKTPLIKEYDVYRLKDKESLNTFLIAHPTAPEKLPNISITIGGVMKELLTSTGKGKFLEALYYF